MRGRKYTVLMRLDPLAYLGQELDTLKSQNLYRHLRIGVGGGRESQCDFQKGISSLYGPLYFGDDGS